jgi:predicted lactoylglutathione lyase
MPVTGPDFVALQVRDLEASARFYTERRGPFGRTFAFADPDGYAITVHG